MHQVRSFTLLDGSGRHQDIRRTLSALCVRARRSSWHDALLELWGLAGAASVRTAGGGAVSLAAQYDSQHLKQLCTTLRYVRVAVPTALVCVENPWSGHFKEHCLVQEMIEDKVFHLYRTDFCAAATEALDGAVTVTASGGLAGGVFSPEAFGTSVGWS